MEKSIRSVAHLKSMNENDLSHDFDLLNDQRYAAMIAWDELTGRNTPNMTAKYRKSAKNYVS